jgi:hypothetical protein
MPVADESKRLRTCSGMFGARSTLALFAALVTVALWCVAAEAHAQQRSAALDESPSRAAVRAELQRIEARARQCGAARAEFVARIVIDSSGRGASFSVFDPTEHQRATRDADMGFERRAPIGQKAGARLTADRRACVLRELRSFQVAPFARRRFVVFAPMEIAR